MFQELAAKPAAVEDASPTAQMPQNPFASSLPSSVSTQSPAASLQGTILQTHSGSCQKDSSLVSPHAHFVARLVTCEDPAMQSDTHRCTVGHRVAPEQTFRHSCSGVFLHGCCKPHHLAGKDSAEIYLAKGWSSSVPLLSISARHIQMVLQDLRITSHQQTLSCCMGGR